MPELWEWIAVGGCDRNPHTSPPHGSHDPNEQCLLSNLGYANSTVRDVTI